MPAETVLFSLRGKESTARDCFETAETSARGNVRIGFELEASGTVRRVDVEAAELEPSHLAVEVGQCLARFVGELHFDPQSKPQRGQWTFVAGLGGAKIARLAEQRARRRKEKKGFDNPTGQRARGRSGGIQLDPNSAGTLASERITDVAEAGFRLYAHCLREGLDRDHYLSGRVLLRFTIDGTGRVRDVRDAGSDLPDPAVIDCVAQGFYALQLPAPRGGTVAVTYPILLNED